MTEPDLRPPRARAARADRLVPLAVALAAAAVYANALRNGYALDDEAIVRFNDAVHGFGDPRALLLGAYWETSLELYRPVTLVTYALEWALHGDAPAIFHAVNVVLHAVAAALVARLAQRLGGGTVAALAAGLVFAVHPVHVEAVANIVGRAEILAALFCLWACLLYLARPPRSAWTIAGVCVLYFLALASKESGVTLPALLLVLDALRTRGERIPIPRLLLRNLPLLAGMTATLAAYLGLRAQATIAGPGTVPAPYLVGVPAAERIATAVRLWPEYARLLFWPRDLSPEWGPDLIRVVGWRSPLVWLGLALGLAAGVAAWLSWRRERWIAAAVLWTALSLLPVSNLLFPIGLLLAERSLYLPSIGLAFLFPPLVRLLGREAPRVRAGAAALGCALLVLGAARTWTRTPSWASSETVFQTMAREHPHLWWVEWKAGKILVQMGRPAEALPWYRSAMAKENENHYVLDMDYVTVLRDLGRFAEAEPVLLHAIRTYPGAVPAYTYLAALRIQQGRYAEALALVDRAARVPHFGALSGADVSDRRALAYDGLGNVPAALAARRENLRYPPYRARSTAWVHLSRLLRLSGDTAGARMAMDSAAVRTPPSVRPLLPREGVPPLTSPWVQGFGPLTPAPTGVPRQGGG